MGYHYLGFYWDPTYFLVIIGMVLCLGASALVNRTMNKYDRIRNMSGITGAEAARRILNNEGLYNVQIECLSSGKGDHYDPIPLDYLGKIIIMHRLRRWELPLMSAAMPFNMPRGMGL